MLLDSNHGAILPSHPPDRKQSTPHPVPETAGDSFPSSSVTPQWTAGVSKKMGKNDQAGEQAGRRLTYWPFDSLVC